MSDGIPAIRLLSATDGYVYDAKGKTFDELAELILALHLHHHKVDPGAVRVSFRPDSAPRLVGGGIRTGYNVTPL